VLDLFCKAGGAAMGYYLAGFDVVGVDIDEQPHYPFPFHRGDALEFLASEVLDDVAGIHASPPCQCFSSCANLARARGATIKAPDLIAPVRELLRAAGKPYVIENVPGAPLEEPIRLCGSSFGLDIRRHRLFECSFAIDDVPACAHHWQAPRFRPGYNLYKQKSLATVVGVYGARRGGARQEYEAGLWARAMGIDWMDRFELAQAIPPAFTHHIGEAMMREVLRSSPEAALEAA
jgi:DNA (cytosine-5)-methyltransferase 1